MANRKEVLSFCLILLIVSAAVGAMIASTISVSNSNRVRAATKQEKLDGAFYAVSSEFRSIERVVDCELSKVCYIVNDQSISCLRIDRAQTNRYCK